MPMKFTSFNNVALPRWSSNHYGQIIRIVDQRSDESGFGGCSFFFFSGGGIWPVFYFFASSIMVTPSWRKIFSLFFAYCSIGCSSRYTELKGSRAMSNLGSHLVSWDFVIIDLHHLARSWRLNFFVCLKLCI